MTDLQPTTREEALAQAFHEAYERLAPSFGYETRKESAVAWAAVPEHNRKLMVAVCAEVMLPYLAALDRAEQIRDEAMARAARAAIRADRAEKAEALADQINERRLGWPITMQPPSAP